MSPTCAKFRGSLSSYELRFDLAATGDGYRGDGYWRQSGGQSSRVYKRSNHSFKRDAVILALAVSNSGNRFGYDGGLAVVYE